MMLRDLPLTLGLCESVWRYAEPFVISRGAITTCEALDVTLTDARGVCGRSETYGVPYDGETPASIAGDIDAVADRVRAGMTRRELLEHLPAAGARCALDVALWDLEAKQGQGDPFGRSGIRAAPVTSAYTLGIRSAREFEVAAARIRGCAWIKIKVGPDDPISAVEAVARASPRSALIVDANQAWSLAQLRDHAPVLRHLGVRLLEQPMPAGSDDELEGYVCPIPMCADESFNDAADLPRMVGRYQAVNIKLDKVGGLTAALALADTARALGLDLMVGCMGGTSLAMAPAMVLAQQCRYVDLDGPRLLSADRTPAFEFDDGMIERVHLPTLWG